MELTPAGQLLVWSDEFITVWDLPDTMVWQRPAGRLRILHSQQQLILPWHPVVSRCSRFMAARLSSSVCILRMRDSSLSRQVVTRCRATSAAWCPCAPLLAVLLATDQLVVMDCATPGMQPRPEPGQDEAVIEVGTHSLVGWSPNGTLVAMCSLTGLVLFTSTGQVCHRCCMCSSSRISDVAWDTWSQQLAVATMMPGIKVVHGAQFEQRLLLRDCDVRYQRIAWAGDKLAAYGEGWLSCYSTAADSFGSPLFCTVKVGLQFGSRLAFCPSSTFLSVYCRDGTFSVLSAASGREVCSFSDLPKPQGMGVQNVRHSWQSHSGMQLLLWANRVCKVVSFA